MEAGKKVLLHVKMRWPDAVDLALWPHALQYAVHIHNTAPVVNGKSRLEIFSELEVGLSMKHNHTFRCPVFALQNALAVGSRLPTLSPRARLGLNLDPSPNHAWSINLVLNLSICLVSPQFHSRFDDFFETTRYSAPDVVMSAQWCFLAGPKHADRSMIPWNVKVAGPNHEELLGTISSNDPIQFKADASHDDENLDHAFIQILHRLLSEILLLVMTLVQAHMAMCALCLGLWLSLLCRGTSMAQSICTTWQHTLSLIVVIMIFMTGILNYKIECIIP